MSSKGNPIELYFYLLGKRSLMHIYLTYAHILTLH